MASNGGFSNVQLPENFSEGELKRSYWWVTHRERTRKVGIGAFIVTDAVLMIVGIWGFTDFLAFGGVRDELSARELTGPLQIGSAPEPQEIRVSSPIVLSVTGGRYDFIVPVENPNPDMWVELTYRFSAGGVETAERKGFILPGQAKSLYELGYKSESSPGSVEARITGRQFHRLDRHEISDYESWAAPRLGILAEDARYFAPDTAATTPVSRVTFTLENRTPYSYYDLDVYVLLYRADAIVGVTKVRIDRLRSGEKNPQEMFWYQTLPQVTRVEVIPDLNILDPDVYKAPGT